MSDIKQCPYCFKFIKHDGICPVQDGGRKRQLFYDKRQKTTKTNTSMQFYGDRLDLGFAMLSDDYED